MSNLLSASSKDDRCSDRSARNSCVTHTANLRHTDFSKSKTSNAPKPLRDVLQRMECKSHFFSVQCAGNASTVIKPPEI